MQGRAPRIVAVGGAAIVWSALVLQFWLLAAAYQSDGGSFGGAVWRFFGFFTILTNLFLGAVIARAAVRQDGRGLSRPGVQLAAVSAILLVGAVYSLLLRETWNPQGAAKLADFLLHDAAPVVGALFWLTRPHGALRWRDALWCLAWPGAYCLYAMARGAADGWYAYPFLDPSTLGYAGVLRNMVGLAAAVWAGGALLVGLDRLLGSRAGGLPQGAP